MVLYFSYRLVISMKSQPYSWMRTSGRIAPWYVAYSSVIYNFKAVHYNACMIRCHRPNIPLYCVVWFRHLCEGLCVRSHVCVCVLVSIFKTLTGDFVISWMCTVYVKFSTFFLSLSLSSIPPLCIVHTCHIDLG